MSQDNLCSVVADVACYNMFRCCTGAQIEDSLGLTQSTTVEECRHDVKLTCEDNLAAVYWSVDRGATVINTDAYENCLRSLTAPEQGCFLHTTVVPWELTCDQVLFQGILAAGLQCYYDHECQPNHYCGSDATCRALPTSGQACPSFVCASGLFCDNDSGNCTPLRSAGQACYSTSECQDGLFCGGTGATMSCQLKKTIGVGCAGDWECTSDYCIPGMCNDGASCYEDSDCSGTCSASGDYCYDDSYCSRYCNISGYYCESNADCPDTGDACPENSCNAACNGAPSCGDQYRVVDYCTDTLQMLL